MHATDRTSNELDILGSNIVLQSGNEVWNISKIRTSMNGTYYQKAVTIHSS